MAANPSTQTETSAKDKYSNPFDRFSSKIRRIYIPLPGFRYFHRPSEVDDVDPHFIGREQISQQLRNWLSDTENNGTGAYLITGYRGMGKTSFVSKVIDSIINPQDKIAHKTNRVIWNFIWYILGYTFLIYPLLWIMQEKFWPQLRPNSYYLLLLLLLLLLLYYTIRPLQNVYSDWKIAYPHMINISTVLPLYIVFLYVLQNPSDPSSSLKFIALFFCIFLGLLLFGRNILRICRIQKHKYILQIKVNIGNEVSDTKDVLALFAHSIRKHISEYTYSKSYTFNQNTAIRGIQWSIVAFIGILLYKYTLPLLEPVAWTFYDVSDKSLLLRFIESINNFLYQFRIQHNELSRWIGMIMACLAAYGFAQIIRLFLNYIIKYSGKRLSKATKIVHDLDKLCERIDAAVQEDKNTPIGNVSMSLFNMAITRRSIKNYRPASIREIEQSLINIIQEIHESKILNCRMIIILDELDKLSCKQTADPNANIVYPEFTVDENGVSEDISTNEKKHRILSLLGQLKFFISSAKAKFVFIAGHELYDAYLADVSDREYSVSSIFNGVINVDSFFTCDQRTKDITRMTECFLCKHLMGNVNKENKSESAPKSASNTNDSPNAISEIKKYNFAEYAKSLQTENLSVVEQREIEAALDFLRQFVTYLTFMSNGAPKKLITTLEKYVISYNSYAEYHEQRDRDKSSIFLPETGQLQDQEDKKCYILTFRYYDQQKIGFIHYMANPIFENIISPSSDFGDKLLVASSFLIAHIYKYHNSGFSRRNLEYMPELLDSNRSPELRSFIDSIIGYLGQIHLTSITSGIYSYKFPMRLSEEISMFSKKYEEISAIFNFSLDDSLAVKKFYYRLFDFYHQKQNGSEAIQGAFHHTLGDIHMANKEYTEAITQYRLTAQAIDALLQKYIDKSTDCAYVGTIAAQIMRYTRVMLKLGLAYEKRNSLDSAYMIYSTLTTRLMAFREIDESALGLTHSIVKSRTDDTEYFNPDRKRVLIHRPKWPEKPKFAQKCYLRTEDEATFDTLDYWTYGDELTDNLCDQLSPTKYAMISKLSVFEDLRLAYLPILAKLFVLEKHNICGITKDNVKIADAEFRYLFHITNSKDKYLLRVDFYRKFGDVLYYKNGSLYKGNINSPMSMISNWGFDLKSAIFDYCYRIGLQKSDIEEIIDSFKQPKDSSISTLDELKDSLKSQNPLWSVHFDHILEELPSQIKNQWVFMDDCRQRRQTRKQDEKNTLVPCAACNCYARSLTILLNRLTGEKVSGNVAYQFLQAYKKGALQTKRYNELTQTALCLSSMGNILLSCATESDEISNQFISALFKSSAYDSAAESELRKSRSHLERAILHYWTAMHYHNLASNYKEGIQCLTWIFNIISGYLAETDIQHEACKFYDARHDMKRVVEEAIDRIHSMRDYAGLKEVNKMKSILRAQEKLANWHNLGLTSVMPDAEELLLVYYEVLLAQLSNKDEPEYLQTIGCLYNSPSLTYLRNESLTYNRVIALLFKAKLNERLLWLLQKKKKSTPPNENTNNLNSQFKDDYLDKIAKALNINIKNRPNGDNLKIMLDFLISDSIFCLTSIADFIQPTARTSLFTNSFCFSIHKRLLQWVQWKEWVEKQWENNYSTHEDLSGKTESLIEEHNKYVLKQTYLKGMLNKYYDAARAMHNGGLEYQNFINDMYLLDDDLQNNTCQFYFALERYKIRAGHGKREDMSNVGYFSPKSYFEYKKEAKNQEITAKA